MSKKAPALLAGVSYETIRDALVDLPMTWYPDLIRSMVDAAYAKGVFLAGKAGEFIQKLEARGAIDVRKEAARDSIDSTGAQRSSPEGRPGGEQGSGADAGEWQEGRPEDFAGSRAYECDWTQRRADNETRRAATDARGARRHAAAFWLIQIKRDEAVTPWRIFSGTFTGELTGVELLVARVLILDGRRVDTLSLSEGPKYFMRVFGQLRLIGEGASLTAVIGWWWT